MNMLQILTVGNTIKGYCNGYFGKDDYENKVCILVAPKYAVFQYENGFATILNYREDLSKKLINEWKAFEYEE